MGYIYVDTPQPNEIYIDDNTFLRLFNGIERITISNIQVFTFIFNCFFLR